MQTKTLLSRVGIPVIAALAVSMIAGMPAVADDLGQAVTVDPSPVCLAHDFTVHGTGQALGSYDVSITNPDGASLVGPGSAADVDDTGAFTVALTALPDAPTGAYTATFTPTDPAVGTLFTAPVSVSSCIIDSSVPLVTGTAAVGRTLTVDRGAWTPDAALTTQWRANGVDLPGKTGDTLTLDSTLEGKRISVAVTGADGTWDPVMQVSGETAMVIRSGAPTITGSPVVGSTLTAKPGTWTTGASLTYQWNASGTAIPGATATTYKPTTLQDGKRITVTVSGAKANYATDARTSAATAAVMRPATPQIIGYAAVGLTLKAAPGTWSTGASLSYRWFANGTAIAGATGSAFKLTAAQRDKRISVTVTGKKTGYPTVARASASTLRVTISGASTITGTPLAGATLTAHHGTWATGTTFAYRWSANGVAITGATKSTLFLGSALKNKNITVTVTGKKTGYATVVRTSAATLKVATASTPTISGTKQVGKILTAHPGTWTTGTAFSYQWYAAGTAITGAKYSTLKLSAGTKGKRITVKVTGRKAGYPTITKTSAATATVAAAPRCDPNYAWACVPIASDVDCLGGGGNGPAYVKGPVLVIGTDIYHLDSDGDGIGCETP